MSPRDGGSWRSVAALSTVGLTLVACIVVGFVIGHYLDRWLHTEPWLTALFFLLGAAAGFVEVFRIAKRAWDDDTGSSR
jgi:ATP synthase protein I